MTAMWFTPPGARISGFLPSPLAIRPTHCYYSGGRMLKHHAQGHWRHLATCPKYEGLPIAPGRSRGIESILPTVPDSLRRQI